MKILVVASDGATLGLAQGIVREGHEVDVFPLDMQLTHTGNEIYKVTTNLWKAIQDCNFIVADRGWPKLYERAKNYNRPIIGSNPYTDQLNEDCVKEFRLGRKLGARYPDTEIFNDHAALQPKILSGKYRRYYVKLDRKTFVCTAPEWLAWAMYQLPVGKDCLLQSEVKGEEISIIGWHDGLKWAEHFLYANPRNDDAGAVVMLAAKKKSELIEKTIFPFHHFFKKVDYKGPVTANVVIGKKGEFYLMNINVGITTPAIYALFEGLKGIGIADFLNQTAFSSGNIDVTFDYLMGIEVSSRDKDMYGAPILGIEEGNLDKIFLHGAYKNNEDVMMSGETNAIYTAVAHGRSLDEASRRVYRTIDKVKFPRMHYVSNLQGISSVTFNKLKAWGVL